MSDSAKPCKRRYAHGGEIGTAVMHLRDVGMLPRWPHLQACAAGGISGRGSPCAASWACERHGCHEDTETPPGPSTHQGAGLASGLHNCWRAGAGR